MQRSLASTIDLASDRHQPLEAKKLFSERPTLDRPIITTCGSGVTASLDAFALALLGAERVAVYDGSWAEWGDLDDVPIATGDPARA